MRRSRRIAVRCSLPTLSRVKWIIRATHLVILALFLTAIHATTVALCLMLTLTLFQLCLFSGGLRCPRLPSSQSAAEGNPEDCGGARCGRRRRACSALVRHKSVQTFHDQPAGEGRTTCKDLGQDTAPEPECCCHPPAETPQINNDSGPSQTAAALQLGEHEKAVNAAKLIRTTEQPLEETPAQQPHDQPSSATEKQQQDGFSIMAVGMPGHDGSVTKQELGPATDSCPDVRRVPLDQVSSPDSEITRTVAFPEKVPGQVHKTEKKICSSFVKESLQIALMMQKKPAELDTEEPLQKLANDVEILEAGKKATGKSNLKRDLMMSQQFTPQSRVEAAVYMSREPQSDVHENDGMWCERSRLASFALNPSVPGTGVWVTQLAEAGFYCPDQSGSLLRCAFCRVEVEIDSFRNKIPREVHRRQSPSCPLVKGEAPNNVSMEQQRQQTSTEYTQDFFGLQRAGASPVAMGQSNSQSQSQSQGLHQEGKPPSHVGEKENQVSEGRAAVQSNSFSQPISSGQSSESSLPAPVHGLASPPAAAAAAATTTTRITSTSHGAQSVTFPVTGVPPGTPTLPQSAGTEETRTAEDGLSSPPEQPERQLASQSPREEAPAVDQPNQDRSQTPERTQASIGTITTTTTTTIQNSNAGSQAPAASAPSAQTTASSTWAAAGSTESNNNNNNNNAPPVYQTARQERRTEEPSHAGSRNSDTTASPAAGSADDQSPPETAGNPGDGSEVQVVTYAQLGIYTQEPKRPDFAIAGARVRTYTNWPHCATHTPDEMAEAGFYYVGVEDLVRCFYCKGGLKTWSLSLRPWLEHARFYPHCPFVGQVKGQEFIQVVQELKKENKAITEARVEQELRRRQPAAASGRLLVRQRGGEEEEEEEMRRRRRGEGRNPNHPAAREGSKENGAGAGACGGGGGGGGGGQDVAGDDDPAAVEEDGQLEEAADKLEIQNDEIKNERICKICQVADVSILFLPCGHLVSCSHCAPALRTCAVCRQRVKGRVRVLEDDTYEQYDTEPEGQAGLAST